MTFTKNDGVPKRSRSRDRRRLRSRFAVLAMLAAAGVAGVAMAAAGTAVQAQAGGLGWSWFKTDTHVHSAFSGDAVSDLGIISASAKANGYNAIFLTDHNLGSSFPVSIQTANDVKVDDTMPRWFTFTGGAPTAVQNAFEGSPAPVTSGTKSLHLAATATASGESAVWTKRGANLRSGDDVLTFAVYPKAVSSGSSLYVSASLGGDPTISPPPGYTTSAGVISPGKSKVFVYYIGAPPPASAYPGAQLFTFNLLASPQIAGHFSCDRTSVVLNAWTRCTVNLTKAVSVVAQAERPLDYNGFSDLKIAAAAAGGTADAYFDAYRLTASAPEPAAQEYVRRNGLVSQYDAPDFRIHPGVEMGISQHTGRFDFGFSDPAAFRSYKNGVDGVGDTHAGGYPAQLDHPGVPGGVTDQEAITNNAYGADLMETRFQNMIDDWDAILGKGVVLLGAWSTDNHVGRWSAGSQATYIQAPSVGFDDLMRSLYEGRLYMATNSFAGRVTLNPDPASPDGYPARYPVFVPDTQTSASARLAISGGIAAGSKVRWITNGGATLASDPAPGASYDAVRTFPITSTPITYVRAELLNASGIQTAMTEPLVFKRLSGLPAGMSFHADGVTTANGRGYTNLTTMGITAGAWDASPRSLTLTLVNPVDSMLELQVATAGRAPQQILGGGSAIPRASTLADFRAASGPSWFYDGPSALLRVRARQSAATTAVVASFATADAQAPSVPGGLSGTAITPTRVALSWSASSDDVGVAGYTLYRNGTALASVDGTTTSFEDATASPGTTYAYAVDAVDAAANRSARSAAASVSTPASAATAITLTPVADTYVNGGQPASKYGSATTLRVDASPDTRSYLRFTVDGLSTAPATVTLRLLANTKQAKGYDVSAVADQSWTESTLTFAGAPALGAALGSSGPTTAGAWTSVDLTSFVTGNGTYGIALTTGLDSAISFPSRESGANAPQLVIQPSSAPAPTPDAQAPSVPGGLGGTATAPTRVALGWSASSDNVGVTGYTLYRNGSALASVDGATTSFEDTTASAGTTYAYAVDAVDAAANRSARSAAVSVTTPAAPPSPVTVTLVADAYVNGASPSTTYGGGTALRVDATPDTRSYLRFTVSGLSGTPSKVMLRVYASSAQSVGYDVFGVADTTWGEGTINYSNAPPFGAARAGSSGAAAAGSWTSVDVTSLVTGNGTYSLGLSTTSGTALSLASRESGANSPQLVVTP